MSAVDQRLNCGAAVCALDHGAHIADAGMDFIRCPTCRVLHIAPENLIHATVLPDPVAKLSVVMMLLMSLRMRWLVRELPRLAHQHVRIADIGCGDGQFLEFLKARGYDHIAGIEPDALRARNARKRGVPVFASRAEAESAGLLKQSTEIMFVWHVLEHIERPAEFIKEYSRWLAPSGVMVISVPNQGSIQTRLFGYFSAYPDYGRHIWYHTTDYLNWFVPNAPGLDAKILRDRNYEYEVFSWVDSIASAIVRRQNFVHKALKKGEGGPLLRLAAASLALCLLPVAAVLAPLSIHAGRGSTLTFVLRPVERLPVKSEPAPESEQRAANV
jgi:SAM-dependent methyltransferase